MNALYNSFRALIGKRPPALQIGAICVDPKTGRVLLVTSRGTGRWIIPKGWPMEGATLRRAAAREAWEEAGVEGDVQRDEIGRYHYDKDQDQGFSVPVEVCVFKLIVTRQVDEFPEKDQRRRGWFTPEEAALRVVEPGLKQLLRALPPATG